MAAERVDLDELETKELRARLEAGLRGDKEAMTFIVLGMTPVIQMRVARALSRRAYQARGRSLRADVEDLVQEVFAALFSNSGKALRAWDPDRGLSFTGFVSFLAEREVGMLMRTGKRNPWTEDPTLDDKLHQLQESRTSHEDQVASRQMLSLVSERLRERLSPLGRLYFQRLYIEDRSVQDVADEQGTTVGALYTWRSRLLKLIREVEKELAEENRDGV